jgi:hypothetical protein
LFTLRRGFGHGDSFASISANHSLRRPLLHCRLPSAAVNKFSIFAGHLESRCPSGAGSMGADLGGRLAIVDWQFSVRGGWGKQKARQSVPAGGRMVRVPELEALKHAIMNQAQRRSGVYWGKHPPGIYDCRFSIYDFRLPLFAFRFSLDPSATSKISAMRRSERCC